MPKYPKIVNFARGNSHKIVNFVGSNSHKIVKCAGIFCKERKASRRYCFSPVGLLCAMSGLDAKSIIWNCELLRASCCITKLC